MSPWLRRSLLLMTQFFLQLLWLLIQRVQHLYFPIWSPGPFPLRGMMVLLIHCAPVGLCFSHFWITICHLCNKMLWGDQSLWQGLRRLFCCFDQCLLPGDHRPWGSLCAWQSQVQEQPCFWSYHSFPHTGRLDLMEQWVSGQHVIIQSFRDHNGLSGLCGFTNVIY